MRVNVFARLISQRSGEFIDVRVVQVRRSRVGGLNARVVDISPRPQLSKIKMKPSKTLIGSC
jgi:hypothetical protein